LLIIRHYSRILKISFKALLENCFSSKNQTAFLVVVDLINFIIANIWAVKARNCQYISNNNFWVFEL